MCGRANTSGLAWVCADGLCVSECVCFIRLGIFEVIILSCYLYITVLFCKARNVKKNFAIKSNVAIEIYIYIYINVHIDVCVCVCVCVCVPKCRSVEYMC